MCDSLDTWFCSSSSAPIRRMMACWGGCDDIGAPLELAIEAFERIGEMFGR